MQTKTTSENMFLPHCVLFIVIKVWQNIFTLQKSVYTWRVLSIHHYQGKDLVHIKGNILMKLLKDCSSYNNKKGSGYIKSCRVR